MAPMLRDHVAIFFWRLRHVTLCDNFLELRELLKLQIFTYINYICEFSGTAVFLLVPLRLADAFIVNA